MGRKEPEEGDPKQCSQRGLRGALSIHTPGISFKEMHDVGILAKGFIAPGATKSASPQVLVSLLAFCDVY